MVMTQERLQDLLRYDKDTGIFTWRNKKANKAGSKTTNGYIQISVGGKRYAAHRLAWLYIYGYIPEQQLDHINRQRDCNKITNLRLATQSTNNINKPIQKNNTTGFRGVSYHITKKKYVARVGIDKRLVHLGYFETAQQAHDVYVKFLGETYGQFAQ